MTESSSPSLSAFEGLDLIASGSPAIVRDAVLAAEKRGSGVAILVFDNETGAQTDLDFRPDSAVSAPSETAENRRAGRPKLGVVGREVTLLPRHWDWLAAQKGGASVALRRLVDEARKASETKDIERLKQEAAYRFMAAIGGNLPGFEEAARALFGHNARAFADITASWPRDVGDFARRLASGETVAI